MQAKILNHYLQNGNNDIFTQVQPHNIRAIKINHWISMRSGVHTPTSVSFLPNHALVQTKLIWTFCTLDHHSICYRDIV